LIRCGSLRSECFVTEGILNKIGVDPQVENNDTNIKYERTKICEEQ
jgi:hypothetical protein